MSTSTPPRSTFRGREAARTTDIPARGWGDVLWRVYQQIIADHVLVVAGGVTFYILLALVPALTAFVSLYGLFADPQTLEQQTAMLRGVVPEEALGILREQLRRLAAQGETALGLTTAISLAIALWSANAGMKSLFEAMNIAYDEIEKRSFVRLTLICLAFTLSTIFAVMLLIGLVLVLPQVIEAYGFGDQAQWALRIGGFVLVFVILTAGLAALYRWGPSRQTAKWRWITPGAVLTIVLTMIASGLFSWYAANFGSYNATYGSLGAIIGFMTWLWITAIILIVGAELNSEAEHQTRQDTTTGAAVPMGRRGAVMADTLGASYGSEPAPSPAATSRSPAAAVPEDRRLPVGRLAVLLGLAWLQKRNGSR